MRKVEPKEMDPTYTTPAPFAQDLINEALTRHSEILLIAIHAQPPGHPNLIVASNFGRIGKIGDVDDMRCIHTGKPNLEVNGLHYEVELPLLDASGKTLGALGVVFNYKPGDNKETFLKIATATRDEMQRRIHSNATLFGPGH
jgi:iron complex outermembrane receptor protein